MADKSYKLTLSLSDGSTINAGTITAPQGPTGANGVTFTPSVSAAGVLSWTNNGGLTNPSPINIKGPKGDDAVITESDVAGWGFTKNKGTVTSVAVKMNGATKGTVTSSGTIDLGTVLTSHQDISGKLDKTTYEVNKTINFGSSGVLYVGKFKVYDTNITCEITSTTSVTYSGKLVIATQNYVIQQMTVYGDAANTVAPNFFIKPSSTSDQYVEIYFKPSSYSKNVVHIYGSAFAAEPTNVCTNVSAVPSTATSKPTNALTSHFTNPDAVKSVLDYGDTSKKIKIGYTGTGISGSDIKYIAGYTAGDSESYARIKDISKDALKSWLGYATVATSGSYNDLSDRPTIPGALQWVTPTSADEIVSAIMWRIDGDAITHASGMITLNGAGSGKYGVVNGDGPTGVYISNNTVYMSKPNWNKNGSLHLSYWKILKQG